MHGNISCARRLAVGRYEDSRIASDRLGRLSEDSQECAPHALSIREPRFVGNGILAMLDQRNETLGLAINAAAGIDGRRRRFLLAQCCLDGAARRAGSPAVTTMA